jgi:hypothetical protein
VPELVLVLVLGLVLVLAESWALGAASWDLRAGT